MSQKASKSTSIKKPTSTTAHSLELSSTLIQNLKNSLQEKLTEQLTERFSEKLLGTPYVERIKKQHQAGNLTLVLGAGISSDYKLPSWNELLKRLLVRSLDNTPSKKSDAVASLFNDVFGPNSLIAARYLKLSLSNESKEDFNSQIRDALYAEYENSQSSNYHSIVRLCASPGKTPSLNSVITYNYDNILEECIDSLKLGLKYKVIDKAGQNPSHIELPIYHVHGYLPREGELSESSPVLLADDSYHQQYTELYHWSNLIQINKFIDTCCLFIGHSFTDPNLRRLLDIARKQRGNKSNKHFLIKKKYQTQNIIEKISEITDNQNQIEDTELTSIASELIETIQKFENADAASFGVELIWIDNYSEISDIISQILE